MDRIRELTIEGLRQAREELLNLNPPDLTYENAKKWQLTYSQLFSRVSIISDHHNHSSGLFSISMTIAAYQDINDETAMLEMKLSIVEEIDKYIVRVDSQQIVRPILETMILQVKDQKLAELLNEFNRSKDSNPNIALIGFRTILCLIIKQRAIIKNPSIRLATKDDMNYEPDIQEAIRQNIFQGGEEKLLKRYLSGGNKDRFDNISHKSCKTSLATKDNVEDAVNLLNDLLPTII